MSKTKAFFLSGIIAFLIFIIGSFIYTFSFKNHHTEFGNYKKYLWLINDTVKNDIDTFLCVGEVRDRDLYYSYKLNNIFIGVWEFKDLKNIDLKNISLKNGIDLSDFKLTSGEDLNVKDNWVPKISVRHELPFNNSLNINLNSKSQIHKYINAENYKGFFGTINKLSFSNRVGEHLILLNYGNNVYEDLRDFENGTEKTLFLMYKTKVSFYVIFVNSSEPFDENVINIFNFK